MRNILIALALLVSGCAHHPDGNDRIMRRIEAAVSLPQGSAPLSHYRRHYAWANDQEGMVRAVYVQGGKPIRLWLAWDEMPIVLDGGCEVVSFSYDVHTERVSPARCN